MIRTLWLLLVLLGLWEAQAEEHEEESSEEEEEQEEPSEEEQRRKEKEEGIRDHKIKQLSEEAKKWRRRFRDAEKKIAELETGTTSREQRLETAFLRAVLSRGQPIDHDTAWDLAKARGFLDTVKITDDGVEGMDEAIDRVVDRYPWLLDESPAEDDGPPLRRTAPPPKKQRSGSESQHSKASLQQRFPALKKRVRRTP